MVLILKLSRSGADIGLAGWNQLKNHIFYEAEARINLKNGRLKWQARENECVLSSISHEA